MKHALPIALSLLAVPAGAAPVSLQDIIVATNPDGSGGVLLTNGVTATGYKVAIGDGVHRPGSANPSNAVGLVGGTYDGLDGGSPTTDGFGAPTQPVGGAAAVTQINGGGGQLNNDFADVNADIANAIGFHIQFTDPVMVDYFYGLDLDGGLGEPGAKEWKTSFALNGVSLLTPSLSTSGIGSGVGVATRNIDLSTLNPDETQAGANLPTSLEFAYTLANSDTDPDNPDTQVIFDFAAAEVTDLFFFWGFQGVRLASGGQASGVSGLFLSNGVTIAAVPLPAALVPLLTGLAGFGTIAARRRRKA